MPMFQPTASGAASTKSLKRMARAIWLRNRLAAGYGTVYVPNTATVVYVDPGVAGPGTGTLADPYKSIPAVVTNGYTYLLAEGSTTTFTSARFGTGVGQGTVFGTYARGTGARILTDTSRLATVVFTASGASTQAFTLSTASNYGVTFSGLRFTCPDVIQGDRRAVYIGSSANQGPNTIEYCVFDGIDSRATVNGTPGGAAISSYGNDTIIRFNTIRNIIADGIWCSGLRPKIYGNDIVLPAVSVDGPDCVQLSPQAAGGNPSIHDNWLELGSNQKQCLVSSGNGYVATDSGYVGRNVMWGSDLSTTRIGASNSKTVYWEAYGTKFEGNIIRGGQYGIQLGRPAVVCGNIFICDHSSLADGSLTANNAYYGVVPSSNAGDASSIVNNTLLRIGDSPIGKAITQTASTTTHVIANNAVVGKFAFGIERANKPTEYNNAVFGATLRWVGAGGSTEDTPGAGAITGDPQFDVELRALPTSPLIGAAAGGVYLSYVDAHGYPSRGDLLIIGACQAPSDL